MTLKRFIFLFVAALLCACATPNKDKRRAELYLESGTGYLLKGNYPAALRDLISAEQLDPKNPTVQNNLGLAYFVRDKFELAETHIRKALDLDPNYTDARNNLGRVLIELGRYEAAISQLQKALNDLTYPEPEKAWFNMGLAYFRKGQYKTARDKFAETIRLKREHCLGQTFYGRTLLELEEFDRAAETLDNAVGLCKTEQPDEPQYYSGISYYKLGRTEKAVARMEEVMRLYPKGKYAKRAESMLQIMMK
jgi:type IV pilus assembly protein PilF